MNEPNSKQKEIIESNESKIVVVSNAATGKTFVLTQRIKYLLEKGVAPESIVAITFTNNAAQEILNRLNNPQGLFIGTVHSYCNYLLRAGGFDTNSLIDNEQFDELFEKLKKHIECIKPVEYLLLDEAQDSSEVQFEFLFDMIKPKNWFVVGDYKQAIYSWNGGDPLLMMNLIEENDVTVYELNQNYRNTNEVLDFAKHILRPLGPKYEDNSISMSSKIGKVIEGELSYQGISTLIQREQHYKDWFILCRTNKEVEAMCTVLKRSKIPYDTFKQAQFTNAEILNKMNEDTVKVLTIHSSKGLENENVVVIGAKFYNPEERRLCYVAATRAKTKLIWAKIKKNYPKKRKIYEW